MLVWVAFRFGPRETAAAAFVLSGIALWGTLNGSGPFVRGSQNESLLLLQSFMGVIALMVLVLAAAVAERRRAEEVLGEKVLELGRSNADLERFAYVASHDLQEPLRMVSSFTELLARRYKGKLDADAEEFIHFTLEGARRMRQLIEDLLSYSRMGSKGRRLDPTDFEKALARALENLRHSIEESGGVVTHDPLPRLVADEAEVIQVFQNLVGNASGSSRSPGVEPGSTSLSRCGRPLSHASWRGVPAGNSRPAVEVDRLGHLAYIMWTNGGGNLREPL